MDKNLRNIEELFKSALEDNEEIPAPKVWNEIDKILDKDNVISIKKKYDTLKRITFFLLGLLFAISIYEFTANRFNNSVKGVNERIDKEIVTKNNILSTEKNSRILREQNNDTNLKTLNRNNNNVSKTVIKITSTTPEQLKGFAANNKEKNLANTSYKNIHKTPPTFLLSVKKKDLELKVEKSEQLYNNSDLQPDNEITLSQKLNSSVQQGLNKITTNTSRINAVPKSFDSNKTKYIDISDVKSKITKSKEREISRFLLSLFYSPDFAYYKLKDDKLNNQSENIIDIEKEEQHEPSSTTGALLDFKVTKHFSFQSGITFSSISIIAQPQTIYAQQEVSGGVKYRLNTSSGYGYLLPSFSSAPQVGDSLYAFTSTHTLQYFSIPLSVKYNISSGKFNFNALMGIAANYLVNGRIETTVENETENETEVIKKIQGLKKIYFSGLTGLGVNYNLNKKIALTFTPSLKFALNSINNNSPVKSYPNSFGLGFGVIYGF